MNVIEQNKEAIKALCEKHYVASLDLVGSYTKGDYNSESDVDFLVTFGSVSLEKFADNYYEFVTALEQLLYRKVDLISEKKYQIHT